MRSCGGRGHGPRFVEVTRTIGGLGAVSRIDHCITWTGDWPGSGNYVATGHNCTHLGWELVCS